MHMNIKKNLIYLGVSFQKPWDHFKDNRHISQKNNLLYFENKNLLIDYQCFRLLRCSNLCSSLNMPQTGICLTRFNQYCWWSVCVCVWGRLQLKCKLLPGPLERKILQEKKMHWKSHFKMIHQWVTDIPITAISQRWTWILKSWFYL